MAVRSNGSPKTQRALDAFVKLSRAVNALSHRLAPDLAAAGLTESQLAVLEALLHLGPLHQCDLAERILKSSGNLTMVIGNLERRRLVRRARSATDRRFIEIRLSPEGARLIRRVFPAHAERLTRLMGVLTEAEQRTLAGLCRKLGLAATGPAGAGPPGTRRRDR